MFSFISPQALHFGRGQGQQAARLAAAYGKTALLVHGSAVARAQWLIEACNAEGLNVKTIGCENEPTLQNVEQALKQLEELRPDVVIALGGGSVMDFAKAIAALLPCTGAPSDYLEVVGSGRPLEHPPIPMIALPTTAGTGAEVTKNAVISVPERGLKVSLRDARMVPDIAIVDPTLMQGAPRRVALSAALDAITQVIEPFLSTKSNPMTDALCREAIPAGLKAIRDLVEHDAPDAWDSMAWVSTCGGLALANAGLGAVHGFAGVIGGRTNAPHGEVCGALLPAVLQSHLDEAIDGTEIHTRLHWVLQQIDTQFAQQGGGISELLAWSKAMGLRGLNDMGVASSDYTQIATAAAAASSMKGNPFQLSQNKLVKTLHSAS